METVFFQRENYDLFVRKKSDVRNFFEKIRIRKKKNWLVVSDRLKNISQIGNLPQIGVNIKNI